MSINYNKKNVFKNIEEIENFYDITFCESYKDKYEDIIIKIYNGHVYPKKCNDNNILNIQGTYYKYIKVYDLMVRYYLEAIKKGNIRGAARN